VSGVGSSLRPMFGVGSAVDSNDSGEKWEKWETFVEPSWFRRRNGDGIVSQPHTCARSATDAQKRRSGDRFFEFHYVFEGSFSVTQSRRGQCSNLDAVMPTHACTVWYRKPHIQLSDLFKRVMRTLPFHGDAQLTNTFLEPG